MRLLFACCLLLAGLTSCVRLKSERVFVTGSVWLVPQAEMEQTVAVARLNQPVLSFGTIDRITVYSRDKVFVYFRGPLINGMNPNCAVIERTNGRWRYAGVADNI